MEGRLRRKVKAVCGTVVLILLWGCWNNGSITESSYCLDKNIFSKVRSGDIVLRMGRGFVSHTICTILSDTVQFSHCGIVVCQNDSLYVVHSVSEELSEHDGVQATSLHHFVYESVPGSLAFVRYKTELDSLGDLMRQKALYYLANPKPFDHDFDLNDSTAFFCSELPLHILKHHLNVDLCVPLGNYPKFSLFLDTIHFKRVY